MPLFSVLRIYGDDDRWIVTLNERWTAFWMKDTYVHAALRLGINHSRVLIWGNSTRRVYSYRNTFHFMISESKFVPGTSCRVNTSCFCTSVKQRLLFSLIHLHRHVIPCNFFFIERSIYLLLLIKQYKSLIPCIIQVNFLRRAKMIKIVPAGFQISARRN